MPKVKRDNSAGRSTRITVHSSAQPLLMCQLHFAFTADPRPCVNPRARAQSATPAPPPSLSASQTLGHTRMRRPPFGAAGGSAAAARLDRLGLAADGDLLVALRGGGRGRHALLDLARHGHEGVLDVGRVLGRRLQKWDAHRVCKLLGSLRLDLPLGGEVALVAHEQLVHILRRVPIDLVQPRLHVLECLRVGRVVDDNDAVGAAVVAARNGTEALLPRRVPNLQLDRLAFKLDGPDFLGKQTRNEKGKEHEQKARRNAALVPKWSSAPSMFRAWYIMTASKT
mmetsp:Transcript_4228/g.9079  ORF Transcript_4228/g.9079 Transcript_4228/m.9079 type:complete len:283 (+) Transcript_4228:522-1370(+)